MKDILEGTTRVVETELKPITLESLTDIWENHEIVPIIFKPSGEIVYTTPQIANFIRANEKKQGNK